MPYRVMIGDASHPEHVQRTQATVRSVQSLVNVEHHLCPGLSSCATLESLSRRITTPYSVFLGDDDFLCPSGLKRCAEFLDAHPEYSAAHGEGLRFQTEGNGAQGAIGVVASYPQAVISASTGAQRLKEFFTASLYTLLYSVHRTETWQAMFQGLSSLEGVQNRNMFKDELIAVSVSVIRGKVKALPRLSLIHQVHEDSYRFPHVYDWIAHPSWYPSFQAFRQRLIDELIRQDGISAEDASRVVARVFWPYLARIIGDEWRKQRRGAPAAPSRLRVAAARIPAARQAWRAVHQTFQRYHDPHSLAALLRPSSRYAADFLPVYRVAVATEWNGA